jgi:chorismate-pyruvate lyase
MSVAGGKSLAWLPRGVLLACVLLVGASRAAAAEVPVLPAPPAPPAPRQAYQAPDWPDSFETRLEALALLQTLNAELLSHDSATLTLERWCDSHHLASPARIVAERVEGIDQPPTAQQRLELSVAATDIVRYRRVRLRCGNLVLSEADNWYVPARLTADMNRLLDTTDTPFGRVVQALHFQRHTIAATMLWRPLPEGWELGRPASDSPGIDIPGRLVAPAGVLQHRALLNLPDGKPISEVVETYTGNVLGFALPLH